MAAGQPIKRIVIGIDGSEHAEEALTWAIRFAAPLKAEIVAVFAVAPPTYFENGAGYGFPGVPPEFDPEWRTGMQKEFEQEWCKQLLDSGLGYRTIFTDGRPASVLSEVAEREDADLVVVGRRGRGGIAELVLGSVSHELSVHCKRPLLLISHVPADEASSPKAEAGLPTSPSR